MSYSTVHPGIEAIAVEIPYNFVDLNELEIEHDQPNKYTKGLRMKQFAVPSVEESSNVLAEKALLKLFRLHSISPSQIGRLEVATESMSDRSKSIKSSLMKHFPKDCCQVEGVDVYHACYAGTSALFSAFEWMLGPWWNGKYAVVICSEIAIFDPSLSFMNGSGAVAILITPNGKLVPELEKRTLCYDENDFYKPITNSYPIVDGKYSLKLYLELLENCCDTKMLELISCCEYWVFHCASALNSVKAAKQLSQKLNLSFDHTFESKVKPSIEWISESGSLFTASLFVGLANLLHTKELKEGMRIFLYAFGSGAMASTYVLKVTGNVSIYPPWDSEFGRNKLNIKDWENNTYQ